MIVCAEMKLRREVLHSDLGYFHLCEANSVPQCINTAWEMWNSHSLFSPPGQWWQCSSRSRLWKIMEGFEYQKRRPKSALSKDLGWAKHHTALLCHADICCVLHLLWFISKHRELQQLSCKTQFMQQCVQACTPQDEVQPSGQSHLAEGIPADSVVQPSPGTVQGTDTLRLWDRCSS